MYLLSSCSHSLEGGILLPPLKSLHALKMKLIISDDSLSFQLFFLLKLSAATHSFENYFTKTLEHIENKNVSIIKLTFR